MGEEVIVKDVQIENDGTLLQIAKKLDKAFEVSPAEGWEEKTTDYIKKNALGLVCECGGGGMTGGGEDYKQCEQCNGCGIYRWEVYGLIEHIKTIISSIQHQSYQKGREEILIEMLKQFEKPVINDKFVIQIDSIMEKFIKDFAKERGISLSDSSEREK